jgi:AcrR family transcriptional regulator
MTEYGGGDPARTLALLWRTPQRPSRGPKPGLTVDQIVEAAIALADAEGLAALSMRRVAEALGVGTMTLYRYVPGKAELIDVMFDRVCGEEALPDGELGGWRAKLELFARESWKTYQRHPWVLQVAKSRPPLGPNVIAGFEAALRAVDGIGLTASEMVATVELVGGFVRGVAQGAIEAAQAERQTGVSDEQWWSERASFWDTYFSASRYPTISSVYAAGAYDAPEDSFEFGLQRVLDGLAAFLAARAARSGGPPVE